MERASGVLMHISSLWGEYSEGSFGENALKWIDFLKSKGFSYWQVLPFCLPDDCNSPYKSYSAFSVNPFFIDLLSLNKQGLLTDSELASAKQENPYCCEFERLKKERVALLSKAALRFKDKEKIESFFKSHEQSLQFCRFMALKKANGEKMWTEWETEKEDKDTYEVWKFIVYIFFEQWEKVHKYANENGVKIIGDIPIYVSFDSSDVWANPDEFLLDEKNMPKCVAGVPPDYFCEDGQLWGNPLYDWNAMEEDGFSWWCDRMKFMTELFDGVRIDHFRAVEAYYSVPYGEKTARNGKWCKGPGMSFIKAIKKVCGKAMLIAEDLGDITDEVRELVKDSGLPGMRVLQFGFLGDSSSPHLPHNYEKNCIAYTGTHDNNTLLGYVWEIDESTRKRLLSYVGYMNSDWNGCYDSILRTMMMSSSDLVIFPIQDILLYGSDTRFNKPGESFGNWGFRITFDQLKNADTEKFRMWNELYGRA